jgi:hypothetical protein
MPAESVYHKAVMRRRYECYPSEREFRIFEAMRHLSSEGGPEIAKSEFIIDLAMAQIKTKGSDITEKLLAHYDEMVKHSVKPKKKV